MKFKAIICAVTAAALLTSCSSGGETTVFERHAVVRKTVLEVSASVQMDAPAGMEKICSAGFAVLFADTATGYFAIGDARSGKLWYSNPVNRDSNAYGDTIYTNWLSSQVVLTLMNSAAGTSSTKNSYISSLKKDGVTVKKLENGIRVTYCFVTEAVTLSVDYLLTEDGFYATLDTESVLEEGDERVYNVKILPMFGAQYFGETDGWVLVPDGSGARIQFDSDGAQSTAPYRRRIYGNDPVIPAESRENNAENLPLPVSGISCGTAGLLLIADEGAANGYVNGMCARQITGYNGAYFDFDLRITEDSVIGDIRSWNYKQVVTYEKSAVKAGRVSVRYILLDKEQSSLVGMAAVLRAYITGQRSLTSAAGSEPSVFLRLLCGTEVTRSVMGVPVSTVSSLTTLSEAAKILSELNADGVSGIQMSLEGWSGALIKRKITVGTDISRAVGSRAELNSLAQKLSAINGRLYLGTAFVSYTNSGNGFSRSSDAVRDLNGAVSEQPRYPRDIFYPSVSDVTDRILPALSAAENSVRFSERLSENMSEIGLEADDIVNVLAGDYGKNGLRRQDAETLFRSSVAEMSKNTPLLGRSPNLYGLYELSAAYCLPENASEYGVCMESVPFLQLTLHGVMDIGGSPINADGDYEKAFLRCIAYGMSPAYELIGSMPASFKGTGADSWYSADYTAWREVIISQYAEYLKVWNACKQTEIVSFDVLENGLVRTGYSNGAATVVNFGGSTAKYGGDAIEAKSFKLYTGGEEG